MVFFLSCFSYILLVILVKEWIVCGNKALTGTIHIDGAKNALLAILPASILTKSIIKLENVTPLQDTYVMIDILKKLNVRVIYDGKSKMLIDARNVKNNDLLGEEMKKLRASYYFMGALLGLFKSANVLGPGGCKFSLRPIDIHLKMFDQLGFEYVINSDLYSFKKTKKINRVIEFSKVSVGATINAILSSVRINGEVKFINVAIEPEVEDLINFLNLSGANIHKNGKNLIIKGVKKMSGCTYAIMEDRIEAGTHLVIGACVGRNLEIIYHEKDKLEALINLLRKIGVKIVENNERLIVSKAEDIDDVNLIFDVYPSLPTDLQQPLSILLSKSKKISTLKDNIYPSRYTQVEDLNKMGFNMRIEDDRLIVYRSKNINGSNLVCRDLRGGASLVIAALLANGESKITNVEHIERGYYNLLNKLKKVGAKVYEKN